MILTTFHKKDTVKRMISNHQREKYSSRIIPRILPCNFWTPIFPSAALNSSSRQKLLFSFKSKPKEKAFRMQNYANSTLNCQNINFKDCAKETKRVSWKARIQFCARFIQCTTLHYRTVHSRAVSNISSFQLEGCDILVLTRKTFLVGKFSFICHHIFWQIVIFP